MKKIFVLIITGLFLASGLSACACHRKKAPKSTNISTNVVKNLDVLATMESKSTSPNQVWVGTFQLVWNDLMDELLKQPITFVGKKSQMAEDLNKQSFKAENISESAYYKKWGLASLALKKEIEKGIKDKFNEKSAILDNFDWTPANGHYILYAMLKKDFEYAKALDKLNSESFTGSKGNVEYFGILKSSKTKARDIVNVLFYNDMNDFAVSLKTKQNDVVYFYRTNDNKTFAEYYADMNKKAKASNTNKEFTKHDELKIPNLDFKTETVFGELCNKAIKNSDLVIAKAVETVEFKMDNKGVKLKSEAGIEMMRASLEPPQKSRYFYLTNQYVIFLQDKDKPYFALKVADAKALQK